MLDGINLSDMVQNQITLQPNIDMVQEFKVQQNSFSAEYGRNAGIIVNAVTKPGSNAIHGSVYPSFCATSGSTRRTPSTRPGPIIPFNRNIFGYSAGAPVIRDRTFFFTSYEGRVGLEVASIKTLVPERRAAGHRHQPDHPATARTSFPRRTIPRARSLSGPPPR